LGEEAAIFPKIKGILAGLGELAFDQDVTVESIKPCIITIFKSSIYSLLEISARSALEVRNAKMFRLLLNLAEFLATSAQMDQTCISLQAAIYSSLKNHVSQNMESHQEKECPENPDAVCKKENELLGGFTCDMANVLAQSIKNGSSRSVIDFLRFKPLLHAATIEIDDSWAISRMLRATKDTTCLTPNKVLCESSRSSSMASCFRVVWFPLVTDRILLLHRKIFKPMTGFKRNLCLGCLMAICGFFALILAIPCLVLYVLALLYVHLMHGFRFFEDSDGSNSFKRRCKSVLYRPFELFFLKFKGNQSVAAHTLSLPGMGSLRSLKMLARAPVDIFETPTVRAVVKGMWDRFSYGFYTRLALYIMQLILYSAFACWCVGKGLTPDKLREGEDDLAKASFAGGCVAIVIAFYFLAREWLHCISCLMDEGLKEYIDVGSIMRICSHSLEIASLIMFVQQSHPAATRLVSTYAVFTLWINLMYFTKAIKQISYLVEILTVILVDLIPFMTIMLILIMAVTLALIVLVGGMGSPEDEDQFSSFSFTMDYVIRVAEGRQDIDGSALLALLQRLDLGDDVQGAIYYTAYFYFYFLMCVISVVALNAFIALMGSSYEKVTEKKISQR
jgi:hypothetical protein